MTYRELGILALATMGVFFMVVSSVGVLRLPDVYVRMQAAGKATTLGIGFTLLAAGFFFGEFVLLRMIILLTLVLITGPVAVTAMAYATYRTDFNRELVLNYDDLATDEKQKVDVTAPAAELAE